MLHVAASRRWTGKIAGPYGGFGYGGFGYGGFGYGGYGYGGFGFALDRFALRVRLAVEKWGLEGVRNPGPSQAANCKSFCSGPVKAAVE